MQVRKSWKTKWEDNIKIFHKDTAKTHTERSGYKNGPVVGLSFREQSTKLSDCADGWATISFS
jgi:hypothetical protein